MDIEEYREMYPEMTDSELYEIMGTDEMYFYQDLRAQVEPKVDEINRELIFHKVEIVNGYYSGIQLYVEGPDPEYLVHDLRYDWEVEYGDEPASDQRIYTAYGRERDRLLDWLQGMCSGFGFTMYGVSARFSNGETWYAPMSSGNVRGSGKARTKAKGPKGTGKRFWRRG